MNRSLTHGFEADPSPGQGGSESLTRQRTVQRICSQALVWFGVAVLGVSLYKFISAFWLDASPWPELQLGTAGLILVAAGRIFRNSAFITTLLSENNPSAHARRAFFMLALASFLIGCAVLLKLSVQDIYRYKRLLGEGGILEYSQALILFTSAWIGWLISKDFRQCLSMRLHSVVYAIIAFVMLLVGLEEIAWGQILFGWKTPENIAAVNAQNQTTLHNLGFSRITSTSIFSWFRSCFWFWCCGGLQFEGCAQRSLMKVGFPTATFSFRDTSGPSSSARHFCLTSWRLSRERNL